MRGRDDRTAYRDARASFHADMARLERVENGARQRVRRIEAAIEDLDALVRARPPLQSQVPDVPRWSALDGDDEATLNLALRQCDEALETARADLVHAREEQEARAGQFRAQVRRQDDMAQGEGRHSYRGELS